MRIGVLALQGDFAEHIVMLRRLGVQGVEVRLPDHLVDVDGLIIPGGESTTIGKLLTIYHLLEPIRQRALDGMPIWGTCAGAILIASAGTYRGLQVRGSSRELGRLTTVAVVQAIFLVILADALFAVLFMEIDF